MNTPAKWNKFHLINSVHNAESEPPEPGQDDRRRTSQEIIDRCILMWSSPEYGIAAQDVRDMMEHLLKTKQVVFVADFEYDEMKTAGSNYLNLFVKLGEVVFELDIEGEAVSKTAEKAAKKILESMDDRRNSPTKGWPQDVRDEAINSWAAIIDLAIADEEPTQEM